MCLVCMKMPFIVKMCLSCYIVCFNVYIYIYILLLCEKKKDLQFIVENSFSQCPPFTSDLCLVYVLQGGFIQSLLHFYSRILRFWNIFYSYMWLKMWFTFFQRIASWMFKKATTRRMQVNTFFFAHLNSFAFWNKLQVLICLLLSSFI